MDRYTDKYTEELEDRITKKLVKNGLSEELAKKNARLCIDTYESVLKDLIDESTDPFTSLPGFRSNPAISQMMSNEHERKAQIERDKKKGFTLSEKNVE